jgi:DNA invertase Pin-like site-specific DNA recombinase
MTVIGYARVSTTDQDLSIQEAALKAAGCEVIRAEKRSGTTTEGRDELRTVLEFLRAGDVLMVTRIDRLARSIGDLQDIVRQVKARGASLKATEQPIDTSTAAGKCFLDMLGVFAEFETNLRRERQLEGIAKAKAAGVYKGRPASINAAQVRELKVQDGGAIELVPMRWGLIPYWWKKPLKQLPATFNARTESVADKPMFRDPFRRHRCIIPASGYYEWIARPDGKQP